MSVERMSDVLRSIKVGDRFRVWYHARGRYEDGAARGLFIDSVYLYASEVDAVHLGHPKYFTCADRPIIGLWVDTTGHESFSADHCHLFHAIELI